MSSTEEKAAVDAAADIRRICDVCGQPAAQLCSRCKVGLYCTVECQRKAWKAGHKSVCGLGVNRCTRCLLPCDDGPCRVPHPGECLQDGGASFGPDGATSHFSCSACSASFSEVVKRGQEKSPPTIRGAKWCFEGKHTTTALPKADKRRVSPNAAFLRFNPNIQRQLDELPDSTETLTIRSSGAGYDDSIKLTLDRPFRSLKTLRLIDVAFEKIKLTTANTPLIHSLTLQNVPGSCKLNIVLPELRHLSIHYLTDLRDSACIDLMLAAATKLKTFDSYKLWVSDLEFASNHLTSVDLHRSDSLGTLTLWAPNLTHLGLQGCYGLSHVLFLPNHPLASALPSDHVCDEPLQVNAKNACLGRQAKAAIRAHPRAVRAMTERTGMPSEGMFAGILGRQGGGDLWDDEDDDEEDEEGVEEGDEYGDEYGEEGEEEDGEEVDEENVKCIVYFGSPLVRGNCRIFPRSALHQPPFDGEFTTARMAGETNLSSAGWQSWPVVERAEYGLVYVSTEGRFGYYDDDDY